MISELDETIKQLLIKKGAFDATEINITFETPDREWAASISKPTINIYLYDIRENHKLRGTEWAITKDENGNTTKKKNASRIDISYLITVWTSDIMDEHRLLWHVLFTLFRYHELPEELLSKELLGAKYPIKAAAAQPDGLFNNPADFWSALDNEIKPSINYVVTVPLDIDMAFTAPMVRTKILEINPPETNTESMIQITGHIHEAGTPGKGISEARVIAKEAGMTAITDSQGYYSFRKLDAGQHTFQVIVPGKEPVEISITIPNNNYDLEI
jgi:hypothetical protein